MERYFDENLSLTHMSGKKQTREEFISEIMDGTLNYLKVDTKNYSISVDGDMAHMKVTHTRIKLCSSISFLAFFPELKLQKREIRPNS